MSFSIKPEISIFQTTKEFFNSIGLSEKDLIITNEYILAPFLKELPAKCGIIYEEKYGKTEPTSDMINAIMKDKAGKGYERVIAIGGGAVIDVSKQMIFDDSLTCEDLYRLGAAGLEKKRKLIAVPTTCGTGSEVSAISVALFEAQKTKIGLVAPQLFPDQAVLIPTLLESLPYDVFAASSLDALVHAMESFASPKHDAFSRVFSIQAMERILGGYRQMTEKGVKVNDLLENFAIASCEGGIAFANAGCGGVHAMSFPLGGSFHVPHGKANYYLFVDVFKEYLNQGADLSEMEEVLSRILETKDVWPTFETLLEKIMPKVKISTFGVTEKDVDEFIPSVIKNQQRLLVNMPVRLTEAQMRDVYMRCL